MSLVESFFSQVTKICVIKSCYERFTKLKKKYRYLTCNFIIKVDSTISVFLYLCVYVCVCLCMCVCLCVCFEKEILKNFKCTSEHPGLSSTKQEDFLKTVGLKTFLKFSGKRTYRLQSLFVEICYRSLPKWLEYFYQIYSSFSRAPTEDKRSHQRCS